MNKWLEVSVVARRFNISESTVYRLIQKRQLIGMAAGVSKGYRVLRKSVEDYESKRMGMLDGDFDVCADGDEW